jgi:uncharacterized protein YeaO (DUF488 family)
MLTRYQMARGVPAARLPKGVRQDTRKHTRHVLRPTAAIVEAYLAAPSAAAWQRFAEQYRALLARRFADDRSRFDALAELARKEDVYLGCSCPTKQNPSVRHCHTWLALEFFRQRYSDLDVRMPRKADASRTALSP